jgi:hypothetical protein
MEHTKCGFLGGCSHVARKPPLTTLCLRFCKLYVPVGFGRLSSLKKLALIRMLMSLKEMQLVLTCFKNLVTLHLFDMLDVIILRFPRLKDYRWLNT